MSAQNITLPDDLIATNVVTTYDNTQYFVIFKAGQDPKLIKPDAMLAAAAIIESLSTALATLQSSYDSLSQLISNSDLPVVAAKQFSQSDLDGTNHLIWTHGKNSLAAVPTLFDNTGLKQTTDGIFHINPANPNQVVLDLNSTITGNWLLIVQFYTL